MFGLPLAFAAPAALAALLGLIALYWLLRVTPPRPRRQIVSAGSPAARAQSEGDHGVSHALAAAAAAAR